MNFWVILFVGQFCFWEGYWLRGFLTKRAEKRRTPYRTEWQCPVCECKLTTGSTDPTGAILLLEE